MQRQCIHCLFVFCVMAIVSSLSFTQAQQATTPVYEDFEVGTEQWNVYPGGSGTGEASASAGKIGDTALQIDYTFPDSTAYLDTTRWDWEGEDWSGASQLRFWMYGSNSGLTHSVQIHDNENELFDVTFTDDFEGWQQLNFSWSNFTRSSWQPDDAPDNGLTLTEVIGLTFGVSANGESTGSYRLDHVEVTGDTSPEPPAPEPTETPAPDPTDPKPIGPDGDWTLTFEDGFDTLDTDVWHTMWGLPGAYWDHVQWSDEIMKHDNVWAEDGNLVVRHQVRDGEITSGVVTTRERFSQRHGYFEARMQMCQAQGVLNAFWMQRSPDFWPPEIDVVEVLGKEITHPHTTIHYGYPGHQAAGFNEDTGVNYADGFHTFGVEWNTNELIWYIDGEEYWRVDNPGGNFDAHEMYMQFNMHSGNGWSGHPDMNDTTPCYMKVDHVRVWQRP